MTQQIYMRVLLLALITSTLSLRAQNPEPSFTVDGEVVRSLRLTAADLAGLKPTEVKAKDKDNKEHVFKGVLLADILDSAGVTLGGQLRGENLGKYVLIRAADEYEVVFSLAEVDPEFTDQTFLLAYQVDGKPLPKGKGPFRMVVPGDKKHARWIREILAIKIVNARK